MSSSLFLSISWIDSARQSICSPLLDFRVPSSYLPAANCALFSRSSLKLWGRGQLHSPLGRDEIFANMRERKNLASSQCTMHNHFLALKIFHGAIEIDSQQLPRFRYWWVSTAKVGCRKKNRSGILQFAKSRQFSYRSSFLRKWGHCPFPFPFSLLHFRVTRSIGGGKGGKLQSRVRPLLDRTCMPRDEAYQRMYCSVEHSKAVDLLQSTNPKTVLQ